MNVSEFVSRLSIVQSNAAVSRSNSAQISTIAPEAMGLYQQYKYSSPISDFWKVMNLFIALKYFGFAAEYLKDLDIRENVSIEGGVLAEHTDYVKFFSSYYFGIFPLLGPNSLLPKYDTGLRYDNFEGGLPRTFYDEAGDYDGTISTDEMIKYLTWVLNFQAPVINIHQLYCFAALMCGITDFREISLVNRPDGIKVVLPQREECRNFIVLVSNYYDLSGLPFGVSVEYVLAGEENR